MATLKSILDACPCDAFYEDVSGDMWSTDNLVSCLEAEELQQEAVERGGDVYLVDDRGFLVTTPRAYLRMQSEFRVITRDGELHSTHKSYDDAVDQADLIHGTVTH